MGHEQNEAEQSGDDVIAQLAPMRRYARTLTRDEIQAEDLVHDALVRAYERRTTFRAGADLRTWLSLDPAQHLRRRWRQRDAELQREAEIGRLQRDSRPAEQESRVRLAADRPAFLTLPEEQRAVLHLVAIEGLSYKEAASALGIPIGTLMSRLGRARAALRAFEETMLAPTALPAPPERPARPNLRVVEGSDD